MKNVAGTLLSALIGWMAVGCAENAPQTLDLLIGTYTGSGSEGIYQVSFDPVEGKLSKLRLAAAIKNPSFLTISDDNRFVYSVGENNAGIVAAFEWQDQRLVPINQVSANGSAPCYIDYSNEQDMVAVANYVSGTATFYGVADDGSLKEAMKVYQHKGSGPNASRQEGPHAHCSIFSKDDRFVYVVDLGIDEVRAYPVGSADVEDSTLSNGFTALQLQPGDGPRHLVFHPREPYAFIVNELSNTVVSVRIDSETGKFEQVDRAGTLPDDFKEHSQCADIHITSDGRYLYASNRGHNSIAAFSVSPEAKLERIGVESTRGDWPRNFVLSPDEKFMLVANERSDNIAVFALDKGTGTMTYTGNEMTLSKPVCLKFKN